MSSSAIVRGDRVYPLDRPVEPDEQVLVQDVADPPILVRLLMRMLRDLAVLRRRWVPRRIEHEDKVVDASGTAKHRFVHGFGGRVRWSVVDWQGAAGPQLARHADTNANTLVLVSFVAGTATIRIEEAGG